MSSIAYIVDRKMIEYHRLNGHQTMNFWRLKTSKTFADFKEGDLLFFLAKKTERNKEKGIVGYGQLKASATMGFNKMWDTFKNLNGYEDKEHLTKAVLKITKDKKIPSSMSCLLLENVVFFQSPVYISELGYKISKSLESYIYLDKIDVELTTKILQRVKEDGLDMWTMMIYNNEDPEELFDQVELQHALNKIHNVVRDDVYQFREELKAVKLMRNFLKDGENYELIQGSKITAYRYDKGCLKLVLPQLSDKPFDKGNKLLLGQYQLYLKLLERHYPYQIKTEGYFVNKKMDLINIEDYLNTL